MASRSIKRRVRGIPTSDGAGVKLTRVIGQSKLDSLDPFLLLDEFGSDSANDYIAGFPDHPHRGFETVTYMLDGHMQHKDSGGNTGDLGPGDVQWMTAARGLVHSEMPQQTEGRMRGFQLWLNLPAKEKMLPPAYRDIPAAQIPVVALDRGTVHVIAGRFGGKEGAIHGGTTDPYYWDVRLEPNAVFDAEIPEAHNAFLYAYEGEAFIGAERKPLAHRAAGLLTAGDSVRLEAGAKGARVLVLAGKPLGEPVVQYGPFVMNSREEIDQAIADYQAGDFTRAKVRRLQAA
ncbi:MAG: pirin family protein [Burkholderiales bacterium]